MMDFKILAIKGNRLLVKYGAISFYVYVDIEDNRPFVSKPKSIYIDPFEFNELIGMILDEYRANVLLTVGDQNVSSH